MQEVNSRRLSFAGAEKELGLTNRQRVATCGREGPGADRQLAALMDALPPTNRTLDEMDAAARDMGSVPGDPAYVFYTGLRRLYAEQQAGLTQAIDAIKAAQPRITDEQCKAMSKASVDGAWRATAELVRAHIWRSILIAVAASLLLLIGAFGAGYWFHGSQQLVAGVSAGGQECQEQQGGTICFIPVWAKLPPAKVQ
jgi:hypothetical protein